MITRVSREVKEINVVWRCVSLGFNRRFSPKRYSYVQFNCLYRWHATTSQEDEQWTGKIFNQLFDAKPTEEVTVDDFKTAAMRVQRMQPDITHWTFGGYVSDFWCRL